MTSKALKYKILMPNSYDSSNTMNQQFMKNLYQIYNANNYETET